MRNLQIFHDLKTNLHYWHPEVTSQEADYFVRLATNCDNECPTPKLSMTYHLGGNHVQYLHEVSYLNDVCRHVVGLLVLLFLKIPAHGIHEILYSQRDLLTQGISRLLI